MTTALPPVMLKGISKPIQDRANCEAWALLLNGDLAGSIVVLWSKAGHATARLTIDHGPLAINAAVRLTARMLEGQTLTVSSSHGHAGGGGYDKASAAVAYAADKVKAGNPTLNVLAGLDGRGMSAIQNELESHGYSMRRIV
jgi:hypothetical protein